MGKVPAWSQVLNSFREHHVITVATGVTCAYLGDERNLREYLVADEVVRALRKAGHIVFFLLFDDSMDPLNFRQLRVAVRKDPELIEKFRPACGQPISQIPDPYGCHSSFAEHFEHEFLDRLHHLGCHPTLISTSNVYKRGLYKPYLEQVLRQGDEIRSFLRDSYAGYEPEKLFWPLCPTCGHIDEATVQAVGESAVRINCTRCNATIEQSFDDLSGKLNWKLDCAIRWKVFDVDIEPFNKSYLEPQTGAFSVAQGLSKRFFDGPTVQPVLYGEVHMEKELGDTLLESLPPQTLRALFVERPASDLRITCERILLEASRSEVIPGVTYLDAVKRLLPVWNANPTTLTKQQRELLNYGLAFSKHFLDSPVMLGLPSQADIESDDLCVLRQLHGMLQQVLVLRSTHGGTLAEFEPPVRMLIKSLGEDKKAVLKRLRIMVKQVEGLPAPRFLYLLPAEHLSAVAYMLELHLRSCPPEVATPALVNVRHPQTAAVASGALVARQGRLPEVAYREVSP